MIAEQIFDQLDDQNVMKCREICKTWYDVTERLQWIRKIQKMAKDQFMPCPFTGPKMFCAGPNFLSQPQNLTAFNTGTKTNFTECKSSFCLRKMFVTGTMGEFFCDSLNCSQDPCHV